tara:strand:- start:447 stop:848 length:402 start_codon:yes stop_codon:yes gene_type:complete
MKRDKISAKSIIGKSLSYYRDRGNKELVKDNLVMPFDEKIIRDVWAKGEVVGSNNPDEYRKDECGAWMYFSHYSNRNSQYGWEIDHIEFKDHATSKDLNNLRPLQWQNYACKGSGELACIVTANKENNGPTKV